jgi:hypothetical protein
MIDIKQDRREYVKAELLNIQIERRLLREWFIDQHIYAGMCIDMVGRAFVLWHQPDLA